MMLEALLQSGALCVRQDAGAKVGTSFVRVLSPEFVATNLALAQSCHGADAWAESCPMQAKKWKRPSALGETPLGCDT